MLFIGDVGIDRYLDGVDQSDYWGGCSLNAWLAAREISEARLISVASKNIVYPQVLSGEMSHWARSEKVPPVQEIRVDATGERHFESYKTGALADLNYQSISRFVHSHLELIALPLYQQTKELCLDLLKNLEPTRRVCLDVGTMIDFKENLDFLLPYKDQIFLIQSSEVSAAREFIDAGIHCVCTMGSREIRYQKERMREEICPTLYEGKVIDTTGAGDYFFGRLVALLEASAETSIGEILFKASEGVGRILSRRGSNLLERT